MMKLKARIALLEEKQTCDKGSETDYVLSRMTEAELEIVIAIVDDACLTVFAEDELNYPLNEPNYLEDPSSLRDGNREIFIKIWETAKARP